ncbi:MAG: UDP-N-acetylmuramoyl-L-alanyl-D-glutamate--2,6-diaminopimelate ligase [Thermodesulfobacteria bacterium]|nr:UDP-N-acetylmuramoyl-L-alanyl-D-glutamate--2,6-diaminopimelate ligase [Thermodesulfobacteriota bacterium]
MKFGELLSSFAPLELRGEERDILGVTDDSREVAPGWVFVARRGTGVDGHDFVSDALKRGAAAIVAEKELDLPAEVAFARLRDTRHVVGRLAAVFYGHPERALSLVGITGTNGKTSVSWFLKELLEKCNVRSGLLGTISYFLGEKVLPARETTPSAARIFSYLAQMREAGLTHAVLEVSSHALDQGRVEGLSFDVAAFTNLSRDHLDYHGDLETYFAAKRKLFSRYLKAQGRAVINIRDPWGRRLLEGLKVPVTKVGEDLSGEIVARTREGLVLRLRHGREEREVSTRLFGDFQLENLLVAAGCALALGLSFSEVSQALEGMSAPPGRLEWVASPAQGALVFVDYAHTPEALRRALESLRPYASGRLLVLFGCGGNRDQGKRPEMGRIAEEMADLVILTSDNPRFEDPEAIIADIVRGMSTKPLIRTDRRQALALALEILRPGDVLLVAGKGHEDYQEVCGQRHPFSDREVIREILLTEAA